MATKKVPFCSDAEFLAELKKLNIHDVPPDILEMMKDDVSHLISKELYPSKRSMTNDEKGSASTDMKYSYSQKQFHKTTRNLSEPEKRLSPNVVLDRETNYSNDLVSNGKISKTASFEKYKNTLKSFKTGNYRQYPNLSADSVEENIPAEISLGPISETDHNEVLHEFTSKIYHPKRLVINSEEEIYLGTKHNYPQRQIPKLQRNVLNADKSPTSDQSFDSKFSDGLTSSDDISKTAFNRYKNTFLNYRRKNHVKEHESVLTESLQKQEPFSKCNQDTSSETDYRSSLSSVSTDPNKIKRKVLRHKDGKPVITEEFLDIPSIFNSSYPESQTLDNSKSFSNDDLSWKSNSSTGSISAVSPDTLITPRSTFSMSSTRSWHSRIVNPRKKKHDPVSMYNYYKKFWNEFKPPGEKTHDAARWAVRNKMLDKDL